MRYNQLGKTGIKLSEIELGSWITFSKQISLPEIKSLMHTAFDHGINFLIMRRLCACEAESLMGKAIKEFRREDLVIRYSQSKPFKQRTMAGT
jgi:aryl-alcohol dehydrogenase-like predicted oxidoreductase